MPLKNFLKNEDITSYHFLFSAISPLTDPPKIEKLADMIKSLAISWEHTISMANAYMMVSALWTGLRQKKLQGLLDRHLRDYLCGLHTLNVQRNQGLKRQASEVIEALNTVGITPMLIKGAVQLYHPLHPDFGTRIMSDIDLLVQEEQIQRANETLCQIGYQARTDTKIHWETYHHLPPLFRPGEYGVIELHRNALGRMARRALPTEQLWLSSKVIRNSSLVYCRPDTTHSVLLAFLHSQVSHNYYQRLMIDYKSLHDNVATISRSGENIDWNSIQTLLAEHGLTYHLETYLWIANRLFHLPMPNKIQPTPFTKLYYLMCLATIRWEWCDRCVELLFVSFREWLWKLWKAVKG